MINRERFPILIKRSRLDLYKFGEKINKTSHLRIFFKKKKENVHLEHEYVIELILITLWDGAKEGERFSNEEKDPMTLKELKEQYENLMYGSAMVTVRVTYL